jgi:hypothetical protein
MMIDSWFLFVCLDNVVAIVASVPLGLTVCLGLVCLDNVLASVPLGLRKFYYLQK